MSPFTNAVGEDCDHYRSLSSRNQRGDDTDTACSTAAATAGATAESKTDGTMKLAFNSSGATQSAIAVAAAIKLASVIL